MLDNIQPDSYFNGGECPICFERPEPNDLVLLPCKHVFHDECITRAFEADRNAQRPRLCPYKCNPMPGLTMNLVKKLTIPPAYRQIN